MSVSINSIIFCLFICLYREVLNECKATAAKRRKGSNRLEASGFTEEELFEQQQRLIAEAKQAQFLEEQQEYNQIQFTSDHIKSTAVRFKNSFSSQRE